jgi:hypothetical protein
MESDDFMEADDDKDLMRQLEELLDEALETLPDFVPSENNSRWRARWLRHHCKEWKESLHSEAREDYG